MGVLSIWHVLAIAVAALLLFGRGRMSDHMADFAKGIRNFRKGLTEEDPAEKQRVVHEAEVVNVRKDDKVNS